MPACLALVTLVVADYDEAIAWFTGELGFGLAEDTDLGGGKRWVVVRPPAEGGAALLLAKAANARQRGSIRDQTGGRVMLFLHTDDFWRDYGLFQANGVAFRERPRLEPYGTVAVFADLYGNLWDLIEPSDRARSVSG